MKLVILYLSWLEVMYNFIQLHIRSNRAASLSQGVSNTDNIHLLAKREAEDEQN